MNHLQIFCKFTVIYNREMHIFTTLDIRNFILNLETSLDIYIFSIFLRNSFIIAKNNSYYT